MHWIKMTAAICIPAAVGFLIHVAYGQGFAEAYVQKAAAAGRLDHVIMPPYPDWLVVIAAATALLPTFGKYVLYVLLQDRLPGRNRIVKGITYGFLLLFVGDALLRLPIMQLVTHNPVDVVLVQSLEQWMVYPAMGIVIALLAPDRLLPSGE